MRTSKARTGLRARLACHRRWSVYGKQLPSYTRGGSRMRESRPYGSVRGARDETRVPTATASALHHAARRRGGVAAYGARTAADEDPAHRHHRRLAPVERLPARVARPRL